MQNIFKVVFLIESFYMYILIQISQQVIIGLGYGLALNRWQAIT